MYKQNKINKKTTKALIRGLQDMAQTLKDTQTTVKHKDVSVTITAEPVVVEIQIKKSSAIDKLPEQLKDCLNKAFKKSSQKMIARATKDLENS